MFGKRLKYTQRYQEILSALLKNGLGFIVKDLGLLDFFSHLKKKKTGDPVIYSKSIAERIRLVLEELGPSFIKLGQIASTRVDLIPESIIRELEKLQDNVAPVPFENIKKSIEQELGQPLHELYKTFSPAPLASASIGQVHTAELHNGEKVAVKVRRPNIEEKIDIDLRILADLTKLMEEKLDWAKAYRLSDIAEEVSRSIRLELDYTEEAWNMEKIRRQLKDSPYCVIPSVYWELTTKKVLTMDYIEGTRLLDFAVQAYEAEKKQMAQQFVDCMFRQIFIDGFFHGDPHPGNIIITKDNKIALIDFGMAGRLTPSIKKDLASLIIALKNRDIDEIYYLFLKISETTDTVPDEQLYAAIEDIVEMNLDIPLEQISLAHLLGEFLQISYRYHIRMPADLTILSKTLFVMEGVIPHLDRELSIIEIAQSFGEKLIRERLKPGFFLKDLRKKFRRLQTFLSYIQENGLNLTKNGKIRIEISLPEITKLNKKIDRVSNQLSFSIILLAFSILMGGLIIGASISEVGTLLWNFPVIEVGGVVATLMFLWLLFSIIKHGKF